MFVGASLAMSLKEEAMPAGEEVSVTVTGLGASSAGSFGGDLMSTNNYVANPVERRNNPSTTSRKSMGVMTYSCCVNLDPSSFSYKGCTFLCI